jgi:hypothetical protein
VEPLGVDGRLGEWRRHVKGATVTPIVRPAHPQDAGGILAVVADAFSFGGTRDAAEELAIVRATWAAQVGTSKQGQGLGGALMAMLLETAEER